MNVGERVKERRKQLKLSVDYIAERLNVDRSTVYRYESSEIEKFPVQVIEPLSKILNVSPSYLMGWDDEVATQLSFDYPFYPTSISAGLPLEVDGITKNDVKKISIPDVLMGKSAGSKDIYFTKISGDSMDNVMLNGSLIAVKPVPLYELKDDDIVVFSSNYDYSVKRFYKDNDRLIFRPDSTNKKHTDQIYSVDDNLNIHGKVVLYIVETD